MPPASDDDWAIPAVTRSRVVLEIAAELVARDDQPLQQAKVLLREQGAGDWRLCLFGSDTPAAIEAVVKGEAALALINPTNPLSVAYRGGGRYHTPQPVRSIANIPSLDQFAFVVRPETGLHSFEDIGQRRYPLKVALRGQSDHSLHFMLEHVMEASGFSMREFEAWGGQPRKSGLLPYPEGPKFKGLVTGEIDAIFDEAVNVWLEQALDAGMTVLPLGESTVRKLEAMGYRRATIDKALYAKLPGDILTLDFSGWPIFTHADAPDELVTAFCQALETRSPNIPWQGEGPLPVERMCREAPDTPQDVPLHPAAARYWKERGYLD